jgi:NADPH:quinone reductase-like Zn-dependent oxidoreductase
VAHAGAGGSGPAADPAAQAKGARVITTVSTAEKEEHGRGAGADEVLGYDGFAKRSGNSPAAPASTWSTTGWAGAPSTAR